MLNMLEQIVVISVVTSGILTIVCILSLMLNNLFNEPSKRAKFVCITKKEKLLLAVYKKLTPEEKKEVQEILSNNKYIT